MNGFQIKYSEISGYNFAAAVQKLAREPLQIKFAYDVKRLVDKIQSARKDIAKEFEKEILSKYAAKTESGAVEYKDGSPVIPEANQDAFMKAQEAFGEKKFSIDRAKLPASKLMGSHIAMSASELSNLEPILEDDISGSDAGEAPGPLSLTPAG